MQSCAETFHSRIPYGSAEDDERVFVWTVNFVNKSELFSMLRKIFFMCKRTPWSDCDISQVPIRRLSRSYFNGRRTNVSAAHIFQRTFIRICFKILFALAHLLLLTSLWSFKLCGETPIALGMRLFRKFLTNNRYSVDNISVYVSKSILQFTRNESVNININASNVVSYQMVA